MSQNRYTKLVARVREELRNTGIEVNLSDNPSSKNVYNELTDTDSKSLYPSGMKYRNRVEAADFPAIYAGYEVICLSIKHDKEGNLYSNMPIPCLILSCLCACLPLCVCCCLDQTHTPSDEEKKAIRNLAISLETCCVVENIIPAVTVKPQERPRSIFSSGSSLDMDEKKTTQTPAIDLQKAETQSAIEREAFRTVAAISRTSLLIRNTRVKTALEGLRIHLMNIHNINLNDQRLFGSSGQAVAASEQTPLLPPQPASTQRAVS